MEDNIAEIREELEFILMELKEAKFDNHEVELAIATIAANVNDIEKKAGLEQPV